MREAREVPLPPSQGCVRLSPNNGMWGVPDQAPFGGEEAESGHPRPGLEGSSVLSFVRLHLDQVGKWLLLVSAGPAGRRRKPGF